MILMSKYTHPKSADGTRLDPIYCRIGITRTAPKWIMISMVENVIDVIVKKQVEESIKIKQRK